MNNINKASNFLSNESSPYLLQHANNPVNWYPWCEEAFKIAKEQDKPIFLSIGYSTCHWCHVMEKESFEDEQIAEILNKNFICIKVDKEERPDIDNIYMNVCQILTGSGGWPLSIFLTPEQHPFYAGTYFPNQPYYNLLSFSDILFNIIHYWKKDREKIFESTKNIIQALDFKYLETKQDVNKNIATEVFELLKKYFDKNFGGTKGAPKFPMPHNIYFLLRYYYIYHDNNALEMAEKTLICMYKGGIFDHIGYGFSRYSVDDKWLIPHFEKMLYDNALLVIAYTEIFQITKKQIYKEITQKILMFIEREMTSSEGEFYTAIDADSEDEEGKFYVWKKQEILDILGYSDGQIFCDAYNITEKGNFEGKNIPNLITNKENPNFDILIEKLFANRSNRIPPHKDDKILTGQNGMMIAAFSYAGRVFENSRYIKLAEKSLKFIENNLIDSNGRLLATYRNKNAKIKAYTEDYAYLIWGVLETYYATFDKKYLNLASKLNEDLIKLFWDSERGGLYFTGSDSEKLIFRPKDFYDGAYPSANSISAINFIKLARILNNDELEKKAKQICDNNISNSLNNMHLLNAYMFLNSEYKFINIAGNKNNKGYNDLIKTLNSNYIPFTILNFDNDELNYKTIDESAAAYVCNNISCLPPVISGNELDKLLK